MKTKLLLLIVPLMLCACSNNEEPQQYQAINNQQDIMKEYYRQHTSNQSNLSLYSFNAKTTYDPTYDLFGELALAPDSTGQYYELDYTSDVGVYSGYFIRTDVEKTYLGNKDNVGSISEVVSNRSFWFRSADESKMQLIRRRQSKNNGLEGRIIDEPTETYVLNDNVSHYFSNNINTEYKDEFTYLLSQPVPSTTKQVSAYQKSEDEIVEVAREILELAPLTNPIKPGEENKLTVMMQIISTTTFRRMDKIGWAATSFNQQTDVSIVTDYELNLLNDPRIIVSAEVNISFTYSASMQPYTGEAYVYQEADPNIEKYTPSLYKYNEGSYTKVDVDATNVSLEYKKLHPDFSGYAFHFDNVLIEEGSLYSFACNEDTSGEEKNYETLGFNQFSQNAGGNLIDSGMDGHNLFTSLSGSQQYEFIILISSTGTKSLIAHFYN